MTVITKAALAAELGITKGRVSQYVARGLPTRSDGKLDRETAISWIEQNVDPTTSSKGYFAAAATRTKGRGKAPIDDDNPVTLAINAALGCLFAHIPAVAAAAAREAGAGPDVVERIWRLAYDGAVAAGERVGTDYLGQPPRKVWPSFEYCRNVSVDDS